MEFLPLDIVTFQKIGKKRFGIIIDIYAYQMVLYFNGTKLVIEAADKITPIDIYRNWAYGMNPSTYELQSNIISYFVRQDGKVKSVLKKINKKSDLGLVFIYIATGDIVRYPDEYVTEKLYEESFFITANGYHAV